MLGDEKKEVDKKVLLKLAKLIRPRVVYDLSILDFWKKYGSLVVPFVKQIPTIQEQLNATYTCILDCYEEGKRWKMQFGGQFTDADFDENSIVTWVSGLANNTTWVDTLVNYNSYDERVDELILEFTEDEVLLDHDPDTNIAHVYGKLHDGSTVMAVLDPAPGWRQRP
jgi:hypothetical protein